MKSSFNKPEQGSFSNVKIGNSNYKVYEPRKPDPFINSHRYGVWLEFTLHSSIGEDKLDSTFVKEKSLKNLSFLNYSTVFDVAEPFSHKDFFFEKRILIPIEHLTVLQSKLKGKRKKAVDNLLKDFTFYWFQVDLIDKEIQTDE